MNAIRHAVSWHLDVQFYVLNSFPICKLWLKCGSFVASEKCPVCGPFLTSHKLFLWPFCVFLWPFVPLLCLSMAACASFVSFYGRLCPFCVLLWPVVALLWPSYSPSVAGYDPTITSLWPYCGYLWPPHYVKFVIILTWICANSVVGLCYVYDLI